jgi:hypothetical protein
MNAFASARNDLQRSVESWLPRGQVSKVNTGMVAFHPIQKLSGIGPEGTLVQLTSVSARHGMQVLSQQLQARLEGLRFNPHPGLAASQPQAPSAEEVANRVLGFVENRLKQESVSGATKERLESLLNQARKGIDKGYGEAREIIQGLGRMTDDLAEGINSGYDRIQSGLANLRSTYLGEPAPLAAEKSQAVSAAMEPISTKLLTGKPAGAVNSGFRYQESHSFARAERVGIQVKTRDGDLVTIHLQQQQASFSSSSINAAHNGGRFGFEADTLSGRYSNGSYSFTIEGNLDEGEIKALDSLLIQIEGVASQFFNGNLGAAFDSALKIGFDTDRLSAFSVNMSRVHVEQSTQMYRGVAGLGGNASKSVPVAALDGSSMGALKKYTQSLYQTLGKANLFDQRHLLVEGLFKQVFGDKAEKLQMPTERYSQITDFTLKLLDRLQRG